MFLCVSMLRCCFGVGVVALLFLVMMVGCFRCCFGVGVVVVVVFGDDGGMFPLLFWCWCCCGCCFW